jgi:hypothetical protein
MLAAAEIDGLGFSGFKLDGTQVAALVAAIAEGLVGAEAAGTPEVAFAGFNFDWIGAFLSNYRIRHGGISEKCML